MKTTTLPNCLLVGTGEYTTGYVHGQGSKSDKKCGVVGLVFFDLRRRGKVGERIGLCGTSGRKFSGIRSHLEHLISDKYNGISVACDTFPEDSVERDTTAYKQAMDSFNMGDIVVIFTPDDTHYDIAMEAISRGMHVMLTKPPVKTLKQHRTLVEAAKRHNVLVTVEVHKRFDAIYSDARQRIRQLGDFGFFQSYMSQPKHQLETFKSWAGKSSDISYYLNSHHIDFHVWTMQGLARPIRVTAIASNGVAENVLGLKSVEDTINLSVQWENLKSKTLGCASYTASWAAGQADVHSQQRFFCLSHGGEVTADQAHRGYTIATDDDGFASVNPMYMKYTPDEEGNFAGQNGYGYVSFERFVSAVTAIQTGDKQPEDFNESLPTMAATATTTAILEAGRISLDNGNRAVAIRFDPSGNPVGLDLI